MEPGNGNQPSSQVARLKQEIAEGRVVVIAGSGVSVAACGQQEVAGYKVATWRGLLEHGVGHLREMDAANKNEEDLLLGLIRSGTPDLMISAAETITKRMKGNSGGTFRAWLKQSIGQLKVTDPSILEALSALSGVLATLNYDDLLEQATGRRAITWQQPDAVQDCLRGQTSAILHLHGHFTQPDSVVLGVSSYNRVKEDPHASVVLQLLTIQHTVLFVGCGDTVLDPNFAQLLEWGKDAHKDVEPRHVLLCREADQAAVRQKLAAAPWVQPLAYGADHDDLVPFLRGLAPAGRKGSGAPAPLVASLDLGAYRYALRQHYGRLKLEEDLDATASDMGEVMVTGVFIGQTVRECVEFLPLVFELPKEQQRRLRQQWALEGGELEEKELKQLRRSYLEQSPRSILEVVREPGLGRLVVLGDPGSGKTLLLRYLLLEWAEGLAPEGGKTRLPLLIELRDYAQRRQQGEVRNFLDYLQQAQSLRCHLDADSVDHWLRHHPSRVFFDGLDEIFAPALRQEVQTAIARFADTYPATQIIVTSRVIGFKHQSWRAEGFRHFMLQELDEEQRDTFLRRWHSMAYREGDKGEVKRLQISRAIAQSAAIEQLAGNPLLLTMMAILNRTQELPRDRAELYHQCARLLLHQWKTELAFDSDPEPDLANLDYKDKHSLLQRVAWSLQSGPDGLAGNIIEEGHLEQTLAEGLGALSCRRPDRAARALIGQLRGRNFMLSFVGGGRYAFVHRTFLEYFCALAVLEQFQVEQVLTLEQLKGEIFGHWRDETWHEVLTLLAGMIAPRFIKEVLAWLLQQPDPDHSCEAIFLAARCVGEVRNRRELEGLDHEILEYLKGLIRFDLPYYYDPWEEDQQRVGKIHQRSVQLVAYVGCGHANSKNWLKERAQTDENWAVRQSAVSELARGWKEDPETVLWLKERAQTDENGPVRRSAVSELARGWNKDPEVQTFLRALKPPPPEISNQDGHHQETSPA
ncbi:MAG: SIR2 family protein [Cyanobacteriota bacterium]